MVSILSCSDHFSLLSTSILIQFLRTISDFIWLWKHFFFLQTTNYATSLQLGDTHLEVFSVCVIYWKQGSHWYISVQFFNTDVDFALFRNVDRTQGWKVSQNWMFENTCKLLIKVANGMKNFIPMGWKDKVNKSLTYHICFLKKILLILK